MPTLDGSGLYMDSMAGAFLEAAYRHVSLGFRISEDQQLDPTTVFSLRECWVFSIC